MGFEANSMLYNFLTNPYFSVKTINGIKSWFANKLSPPKLFFPDIYLDSFSLKFDLEFFKINMIEILTSFKPIVKTPLTAR